MKIVMPVRECCKYGRGCRKYASLAYFDPPHCWVFADFAQFHRCSFADFTNMFFCRWNVRWSGSLACWRSGRRGGLKLKMSSSSSRGSAVRPRPGGRVRWGYNIFTAEDDEQEHKKLSQVKRTNSKLIKQLAEFEKAKCESEDGSEVQHMQGNIQVRPRSMNTMLRTMREWSRWWSSETIIPLLKLVFYHSGSLEDHHQPERNNTKPTWHPQGT